MLHKKAHPFEHESCSSCTHSVFCTIRQDYIKDIIDNKTHLHFSKGESILEEGSRPHGVYCIYSGTVKLSKYGHQGKEHIVRFLKTGNLLGYRSLMADEPYDCSAIALEDTKVCFIPKKDFFATFGNGSGLSEKVAKLLSGDLKRAETRMMEIAQKPVRALVAESILLMKNTFGEDAETGCVNVVLSREEIANIAGTATETTIRALSELKQEGVIQFMGKKVKIINLNELMRRAGTC